MSYQTSFLPNFGRGYYGGCDYCYGSCSDNQGNLCRVCKGKCGRSHIGGCFTCPSGQAFSEKIKDIEKSFSNNVGIDTKPLRQTEEGANVVKPIIPPPLVPVYRQVPLPLLYPHSNISLQLKGDAYGNLRPTQIK